MLGELDIVSERGGRIVFTEVKALIESAVHRPADNVHPRKIAKIQQLSQFYLKQNGLTGKPVQFDVVEVVFPGEGKARPRINHIERAF
jgi:Holliday junction resolvase-like predicted endonuclease